MAEMDFLGGFVVKNPPANTRDVGLIPGLENLFQEAQLLSSMLQLSWLHRVPEDRWATSPSAAGSHWSSQRLEELGVNSSVL